MKKFTGIIFNLLFFGCTSSASFSGCNPSAPQCGMWGVFFSLFLRNPITFFTAPTIKPTIAPNSAIYVNRKPSKTQPLTPNIELVMVFQKGHTGENEKMIFFNFHLVGRVG